MQQMRTFQTTSLVMGIRVSSLLSHEMAEQGGLISTEDLGK